MYTVKGFGIINKAEVDVFLELSSFFNYPANVGSLISGSYTFSKTSLNIWKLFIYFWSLAWRILSIILLVCEMNAIVWQFEHSLHCPSLGLEWKLPFSIPVATAEFPKFSGILSVALSQNYLLGFQIAQLELHHLH